MNAIPRDPAFDNTLAFLREGYRFISTRCDRLGSDAFRTRFLLRPAICLRGAAAAEMFYAGGHFTRKGAVPGFTQRLLQDIGSVQSLEGDAHRHRKHMFLAMLLDEGQIARLVDCFSAEWRRRAADWPDRNRIVLFDEVNLILTRAVNTWIGIPTDDRDSDRYCRELTAMIDNAGRLGPSAWHALWLRRRTEGRLVALLQKVRNGTVDLPDDAPLKVIAEYEDSPGEKLDLTTAAVEIINLNRPIVAIGRFIMFAAMQLEEQPALKQRFASGDDTGLEDFAEEVRRFYPFFPTIAGRALHDFEWNGTTFHTGDWVILDLYGTNHHAARFSEPDRFMSNRDISWRQQGYDFIPHGAGDAAVTHRCPGEAITVALIMQAIRLLIRETTYDVPDQDLEVDLGRIPARPESGFVIENVRLLHGPA